MQGLWTPSETLPGRRADQNDTGGKVFWGTSPASPPQFTWPRDVGVTLLTLDAMQKTRSGQLLCSRKHYHYCRFLLTFTGFIYYCGFVNSSQLERRKYHNGGLNVLFFSRFKWQPQLRTSLCGTGPLHRHGPPVPNQAHVFACTACPQPQINWPTCNRAPAVALPSQRRAYELPQRLCLAGALIKTTQGEKFSEGPRLHRRRSLPGPET